MARKNVELTQDAIDYLVSLGKNPELFEFGSVCKNGHDFNNTGYSIRYKNNSVCFECQQKYRQDNKDYYREYQQKYRQDNKDDIQKYKQKHYQDNKDGIRKYNQKYRQDNKDYYREYNQKYYQDNKDYYREYNQKYYQDNKDVIREYNQKYGQKYRQDNPEIIRLKHQKRRAVKRKATVHTVSKTNINTMLKYFDNSCVYCGARFDKTTRYHIDHVIPLSNQGKHAVYNLVPACGRCNTSKNASDMKEWYRKQSFYSLDRELKIEKWCQKQLIIYEFSQKSLLNL